MLVDAGEQSAELETARAELKELRDSLEAKQLALDDAAAEAAAAQSEASDWRTRYAELEQGAASGASGDDDRNELIAKLAEYEREIADLKQQAEEGAAGGLCDSFDWEAQKRRLLADLDEDGDLEDAAPEVKAERIQLREAIAATDQAVEEKQREIDDLKAVLQAQSENAEAQSAVGAAAFAEAVDQDELVQQEREHLAQLKEEWREKLRVAEVEVSVQRAQLSREKSELEERASDVERMLAQIQGGGAADGNQSKRRWLSRLGLDGEE